jgi:hypothetical protein
LSGGWYAGENQRGLTIGLQSGRDYEAKTVTAKLQDEEISIVFLGHLNPQIFQPAWFALGQLIRSSEADSSTIEIIHRDVVAFRTEWFNLNVMRNKFVLRTAQEPYAKHLYDLAIGTFRKLVHTPLHSVGMNRHRTYEFDTEDEWHGFGHFIAPKAVWEGVLERPGLKSMSMQGRRDDSLKGFRNVLIESQPGKRVVFQVNDHYEAEDHEKVISAEEVLGVLESKFFESEKLSREIPERLLGSYAQR